MDITEKLLAEKRAGHRGGIYNKMQVDFAYNSNHIEGSRLTHDQTRYIYETKTVGVTAENTVRVNDIVETVNHFRCFDHILDTLGRPLTEDFIKDLHRRLKNGVFDEYAVIGEYKREPNEVGGMLTASPEAVSDKMHALLDRYSGRKLSLYDIAEFHVRYEQIHPFYDGNGRTGRLIIFKQCLENGIIPFYIDDNDKMFYYMGLKEWQTEGSDERLINVFLASQDSMKAVLDYFRINYDRSYLTYKDIKASGAKT